MGLSESRHERELHEQEARDRDYAIIAKIEQEIQAMRKTATVELWIGHDQFCICWTCGVSGYVDGDDVSRITIDEVNKVMHRYQRPAGWWCHTFDSGEEDAAIESLNIMVQTRAEWRADIETALRKT